LARLYACITLNFRKRLIVFGQADYGGLGDTWVINDNKIVKDDMQ